MVRLPTKEADGTPAMNKIHTHTLRVLHKWVGLLIGLQLLLWTLSGAVMAFLPVGEVAGGPAPQQQQVQPTPAADAWPRIRQQLGSERIRGLALRPLLDRQAFEVRTDSGVRLFDVESGIPIFVDAQLASHVASAAYPAAPEVREVKALRELTLPVRAHELPIWRVDFADEKNSSYYVSGSTGALLERRNDTWRIWDFFWMLHIMDYVDRTSFNHPVIWVFGFGAAWLATTGTWLLFRTGWESDFKRRSSSARVFPGPY